MFSGCLLGQCLGDALGFPVEGTLPDACRLYVDRVLTGFKEGTFGPEKMDISPYTLGQYTDDSQLARELMISYATCGEFDPEDYARRICEIFAQHRVVGGGIATLQAALRLKSGIPWTESGEPPPSAGNGTAMRAGPVGLIFGDNPETMLKVAHDQGRITHMDKRCSAGSVAIAGAVALAARMYPLDMDSFLTTLGEWVGVYHEDFALYIEELAIWTRLDPETAVVPISKCGRAPEYREDWKFISPFVIPSVLWSLYSFLRSPGDYWTTITTAISCGGDVDTTGAMAGAISGAHLGLGGLPEHLVGYIHDRGDWGYDELVRLAESCYDVAFGDDARKAATLT
ncbi:MAG: ADP-ribosylglycohydrolase family protein [bacterium]